MSISIEVNSIVSNLYIAYFYSDNLFICPWKSFNNKQTKNTTAKKNLWLYEVLISTITKERVIYLQTKESQRI